MFHLFTPIDQGLAVLFALFVGVCCFCFWPVTDPFQPPLSNNDN